MALPKNMLDSFLLYQDQVYNTNQLDFPKPPPGESHLKEFLWLWKLIGLSLLVASIKGIKCSLSQHYSIGLECKPIRGMHP